MDESFTPCLPAPAPHYLQQNVAIFCCLLFLFSGGRGGQRFFGHCPGLLYGPTPVRFMIYCSVLIYLVLFGSVRFYSVLFDSISLYSIQLLYGSSRANVRLTFIFCLYPSRTNFMCDVIRTLFERLRKFQHRFSASRSQTCIQDQRTSRLKYWRTT